MSEPFDRGSPVTIEVTFERRLPFSEAYTLFDPTVPKITVTDPQGVAKVNAADLVKSVVGKYYYVCQTAETWAAGVYSSKATGTDGAYTEVEVTPEVFELV